jgi:S1-C subfamily serine protease
MAARFARYLALIVPLLLLGACEAHDPGAGLASIDSKAVGLGLRELPRATLRSIGLPYGLAVVRVDGAAASAGLRMGDVVYGVNQRRFRSAVDFARLVAELPPGMPLRLLVRRGANDLYLPVEVGLPARPPATGTLQRT